MFTFAVLLAAGAALPNYNLPPNRENMTVGCAAECRNSRYRLPSSSDSGPTVKSRALAEDGSQCNLVGSKLCTTTPRRILTSTY